MAVSMIYSTFPNREKAVDVARILVKEKHVACANITNHITSIYEWNGKIEQSDEVVMTFKTAKDSYQEAMHRLKELHPYSCPCITVFHTDDALKAYDDWVNQHCQRS